MKAAKFPEAIMSGRTHFGFAALRRAKDLRELVAEALRRHRVAQNTTVLLP